MNERCPAFFKSRYMRSKTFVSYTLLVIKVSLLLDMSALLHADLINVVYLMACVFIRS